MGAQPVHSDGDADVLRELHQAVQATPPLKSGEVDRLMERATLGDLASQERLVAANLAMVLRLAETRVDRGLPVGDLVQEGSLGLLEAVRTFATDGGADFGAFAERKGRQEMEAALAVGTATGREGQLLVGPGDDFGPTEIL